MGTIIKSSTGKKYELEPRDIGGWRVSRLDSHTNDIVSEENVAESLVSLTKKRLEAGETIKFRDIDYTVAKETAVVHLLKDIIYVDEEKRTYSLKRNDNADMEIEGRDIIGEIEGVSEGQVFETRKELHHVNIHRNIQAGISYQADSIVLSGGYHSDEDLGHEIIYTGHGGRDQNTGLQIADQTLTRGNLKLKNHCIEGNPIRVTRGSGGDPKHSPSHGYRYDGLYRIDSFWKAIGSEGFIIYRYRLIKLNNTIVNSQATTPSSTQGSEHPKREQVTISRVIRNSKVGTEVKQMYDYTCQISGVRLDTPTKPYAEACHIKPLGTPHNGPDVKSNVLCLSPNMHVLFDLGAIAINDDLTLLGMEGKLYLKSEHDLSKKLIKWHREHTFHK